jgi:hypothetical protein
MESGSGLSNYSGKFTPKVTEGAAARGSRSRRRNVDKRGDRQIIQRTRTGTAEHLGSLPAIVRASVAVRRGEYDARRLRSQREVIRDVMLSAAECDTWLTLGELRGLTRYGEASISAQLRHLRKQGNGGYDVAKRHREGAAADHTGTDGRGECLWEYRIARRTHEGQHITSEVGSEVLTTSQV